MQESRKEDLPLSVKYVSDPIYVDLGERFHIRSVVKPVCEEEIPFSIRSAKWELYDSEKNLEASGECTINGHELDALIEPKNTGRYTFKYIYEVADENWVDVLQLRVN